MHIDRVTNPEDVRQIHLELIEESFPPDEKTSTDVFVDAVNSGNTILYGVKLDGRWAGEVALEVYDERDFALISWLSTAEHSRGRGLGGKLLQLAIDEGTRLGAKWLIGEIEDPATPVTSVAHGNPASRAQFYARRGAKALLLDYQQPPIGPGKNALDMLLIAFSKEPLPAALPSEPLGRFLHSYVGDHEATWQRLEPGLDSVEVELIDLNSEAFSRSRLSGRN